ncbi:MAG: metallophosphatase family protein [Actinomycetota bacterium]|nr:metallophosphatase family protein [Actinomycetota bacterium]
MRVAALYDIHANLPALEAVLAEIPDDAMIVVGGDFASGPMPNETIARLRELGHRKRFIRGNADRELVDDSEFEDERVRERREWVKERLTDADRDLLELLDETVVLDVEGLGHTLFCHGSPRSDEEIITMVTSADRLRGILADVQEQTVVCGHTHHQFDRTVDGVRVVNAGSVGMPFEGAPGAYWALLGPDVELRRTPYDHVAAAALFRTSGWPRDDHPETLVNPPPAREAAEFFEQHALQLEAS